MAGPWEKYAEEPAVEPFTSGSGPRRPPWEKYASPTLPEYAYGFAGGFNRGLANMLALPGAAVHAGRQALPKSVPGATDEPYTGDRFARTLVDLPARVLSLNRGTPETRTFLPAPDTAMGRIVERTGEELGATALPAMGMLRGAGALSNTARMMPQTFWQRFLAPIANAPARALGGETAAAAGAGIGAGVAREGWPDNPAAEITGQVVGGLTPAGLAFTPSALTARAANAGRRFLSPEQQTRRARQAVQDALGPEMTDAAQRNLTDAERLRQMMPGFNPTLAEATGSPALATTQRRLEQQMAGQELERIVQRRQQSEAAIEGFAQREAPGAPGTPGTPDYVIDTATREVQALRSAVADRQQQAADARQGVADQVRPTDRLVQGQAIRESLEAERRATQQRMTALADELGINDTDITVPFAEARDDLVSQFSPQSRFEDRANTPSVLADIQETDGPVTFRDLMALRTRVGDDLRDAQSAANPSAVQVRRLALLRGKVDQVIDDLTRNADPELAGRYRQFRDAYFNEYVNRFNRGAAFRVRRRDGRGFYKTPDERVAEAFFQPQNVSAAREFNSVFRGDAEANAALEAVALDSLRNYAVREGTLDPNRFQAWLRNHSAVLEEFPEVNRQVRDIEAADGLLLERQAELAERAKAIEDQILVRELSAYQRATRSASDVIGSAVRDPRKMGQLIATLRREPAALEALKRNIWDRAAEGTAEDILSFMHENNAAMSVLFSQPHLDALKDIAAARAMLQRVPGPSGTAYEVKPLDELERLLGQGIPQLSSRVFAFKAGRMQKGYLVTETLMRGLRGRAKITADQMFREALYDPEVARLMAEAINAGALSPSKAKRLNARLFALGVTPVRDELSDEDRQNTTMNAATGTQMWG